MSVDPYRVNAGPVPSGVLSGMSPRLSASALTASLQRRLTRRGKSARNSLRIEGPDDLSPEIIPMEGDQFFYRRKDREGGSGPALVMPGIPVPVGNSDRDARDCPGRAAPERKSILAGAFFPDMGSTGAAASECPAEIWFGGTEKFFR